jgi:hypothetical protein
MAPTGVGTDGAAQAPGDAAGGPAAMDECSVRRVSYSIPCQKDQNPDPCGIASGWEGDEYCLKPPAEGEGVQIHFGPKSYTDKAETDKYQMLPQQEFNNSVLAKVPLTEDKFWNHVTVSMRPGSHHWISMGGNAGAAEGFYRDTGCGEGSTFGPGGFGGGQNLIYDNPPMGIPAPENVGMGRQITGNSAVCLGLHAYNFTDKPRLREIWVNLMFVDESKVTQRTSGIGMVGALGLQLPPGQSRELKYGSTFQADGRIIQLFGHRHQWTPRFAAWLNDKLIYDSHDWKESVTFNYDSITTNPPIDGMHDGAVSGIVEFKAGDRLNFSCFVENESDHVLSFKNELEGGEMCNMWGTTVGGGLSGSFQ